MCFKENRTLATRRGASPSTRRCTLSSLGVHGDMYTVVHDGIVPHMLPAEFAQGKEPWPEKAADMVPGQKKKGEHCCLAPAPFLLCLLPVSPLQQRCKANDCPHCCCWRRPRKLHNVLNHTQLRHMMKRLLHMP